MPSVDFAISGANIAFLGAARLEKEFELDARLLTSASRSTPAEVTWSGPDEIGAFTAHVWIGPSNRTPEKPLSPAPS